MSAQEFVTYHAADQSISDQLHQAQKMRSMWAEVVLAALDDAISEDRALRTGSASIARWARSRDGQEVLNNAGIDPNERVVAGLQAFVQNGVSTARALSRDTKE